MLSVTHNGEDIIAAFQMHVEYINGSSAELGKLLIQNLYEGTCQLFLKNPSRAGNSGKKRLEIRNFKGKKTFEAG